MEKEKASANQVQGGHSQGNTPTTPTTPTTDSQAWTPFGAPEVRDSRRMQRQMEVGPHIKPGNPGTTSNSVPGTPEPPRSGRSGSPGRRGDYITQWAGKMQQQQKERGCLPGSEQEGEKDDRKGGNSGGRSLGPKIYPPPYEPPPPPPPSTSGGEQHPHYTTITSSSVLPRGPSFRQKSGPPPVATPSSPLLARFKSRPGDETGFVHGEKDRQGREERVGKETSPHLEQISGDKLNSASEVGSIPSSVESVNNASTIGSQNLHSPPTHPPPPLPSNGIHPSELAGGKLQTGPNHQSSLSNDDPDGVPMSVLRQHLQSSSHPQHVQSHFLSRLELMEHEMTDLQERLNVERVQYTQRLQDMGELCC